jgi:hypothetical protein
MLSFVSHKATSKQNDSGLPSNLNRTPADTAQKLETFSNLNSIFGKQSSSNGSDEELSITNPGLHDFSKISIFPSSKVRLQPKLKINTPGDKYEQEADRVAEQVMRMQEPQAESVEEEEMEKELVQSKPQITPLIQRQVEPEEEEEEEEEENIQAKAASGNSPKVTPQIAVRINSLHSGGQPLPKATLRFFEPRFGVDFSRVRIHTGSKAAEISKSINARAFTKGKDVVFGTRQYSPGTSAGKQLLAHELTHVVQQNAKLATKRNFEETIFRAKEDEADSAQAKVITFIMGAPEKGKKNVFYKSAIKYWSVKGKNKKLVKTDKLVTTARMLTDIFDYLSNNPPEDKIPWREVNIVSHANEEGHLSFPLDEEAKTKDKKGFGPEELAEAVSSGRINPLPNKIIGRSTNINIHGCALGKSGEMLKQISKAFGGGDVYAPVVYAPKHIQSYEYSEQYKKKKLVKGVYSEYLKEYWTVEYPGSQKISPAKLSKDFAKKHGVDHGLPNWKKAVKGAKRIIRKFRVGAKNEKDDGIRLTYLVLPRRNKTKDYLQLLKQSNPDLYKEWQKDKKATKLQKKATKKQIQRLYRLMRKWRKKNQEKYVAYQQQLIKAKQQYAQIGRFVVDDKSTREKNRVKTNIKLTLHFYDERWKSIEYEYENPWIPKNKKEINSLLIQTYGQNVYDRHKWKIKKKTFGKWRIGKERTSLFRGLGKRTVYRVERDLTDTKGKRYRPSREETKHYGKYVPQHDYNVIIKENEMQWVGNTSLLSGDYGMARLVPIVK